MGSVLAGREQESQQVIKLIGRNLFGKVRRHGGKLRLPPRFDLRLGDLDLLAQLIHDNQNRALFFYHHSGHGSSILQLDHLAAEYALDIPVGVEHVFNQPIYAAATGSVELGADRFPFSADLVALDAVLLEHGGAARGQRSGRPGKRSDADRAILPAKPPRAPDHESAGQPVPVCQAAMISSRIWIPLRKSTWREALPRSIASSRALAVSSL